MSPSRILVTYSNVGLQSIERGGKYGVQSVSDIRGSANVVDIIQSQLTVQLEDKSAVNELKKIMELLYTNKDRFPVILAFHWNSMPHDTGIIIHNGNLPKNNIFTIPDLRTEFNAVHIARIGMNNSR